MEAVMKIGAQKLKYELKGSVYLCFIPLLLVVMGVVGCATTKKTTTTTTKITETYPDNTSTVVISSEQQSDSVAQKSQTTATSTSVSTEAKPGHPGLISSTVHAIGWVIALPFRLIGGLIGWIF
jgi:uncharacterized BrkB/YihY/UPF0761 family membrane protein